MRGEYEQPGILPNWAEEAPEKERGIVPAGVGAGSGESVGAYQHTGIVWIGVNSQTLSPHTDCLILVDDDAIASVSLRHRCVLEAIACEKG